MIQFRNIDNFINIPLNSNYSTEIDDFKFDFLNFPTNFEIANDDLNKTFLHKNEKNLFVKEINKDDDKINSDPLYDLDKDNNSGLIKHNKI